MADYCLLAELCESRLIPSQTSLKEWDGDKLRKLSYLYLLGLRILVANADTKEWASAYLARCIHANDFAKWRNDANDLYVMLYALSNDDNFKSTPGFAVSPIRDWMKHPVGPDREERVHRLFNRLDAMFKITDSGWKAMRRNIASWPEVDARERDALLEKIIQQIVKLAPKSEILAKLKSVAADFAEDDIKESATAGATGAASVATAIGGLGAGFDPDGDWGIYEPAKPKAKKAAVAVIRRV